MALVVDAHHHFWDPARAGYPWMTDALASIRRRFGPEDLRPLLAANGVDLEGDRVRVHISGTLPIVAEVTPGAVADLQLVDGGAVWFTFKATEIAVYPA